MALPIQASSGRLEIPAAAKKAAGELDLSYRTQKWPRMLFNQEAGTEGLLNESLGMREEGTWRSMCRELFGRLYGVGTKKLEEPQAGCEFAEELHQQADAIPEFKNLQNRVHGDAWRAALGAGQVAAVLASRMPELPEENQQALEAEAEMLKDIMESGGKRRVNQQLLEQRGELQKRIKAAKEASASAVEKMQENAGFSIRSAIREGVEKAQQVIDEIDGGLDGLGCGSGTPAIERRQLAARLAGDDRLRKIAVLAGRLRIQAARKQRTKTTQERQEIVSVTQGDDLQHLLASEVGLLPNPNTRALLFERLDTKSALQYQLGGKATKARGPIIFAIDNSGSMGGARDVWSKACALAMMEVARIQKRAFAVLFFNGDVPENQRYYFNAGEENFARLLEVLAVKPGGGTRIERALLLGVEIIQGKEADWPPGKNADIVLITDGEDNRSDYEKCGAAIKGEGASLYTIGIEATLSETGVKSISDDVVVLNAADLEKVSPKLDGVFSM